MLPDTARLSAGRIRRLLDPLILAAVADTDADRYRKCFPAFAHVWMLVLHALSGNASLRQSHAGQAGDRRLRDRLGMPGWISYSQLARSSTSRPAECFERVFSDLVREARKRPARSPDPAYELLRKTAALDSAFFRLSAKMSPWGKHKGYAAGVRLQTTYDLARAIPDSLRLTLSDENDRKALGGWDLSGLRGWTLIVDLGYYAHRHFARLLDAGVSIITRLQAQVFYVVVESLSVPEGGQVTPEGDTVLKDERITLGSPNNRTGTVLPDIRCGAPSRKGGAKTPSGSSPTRPRKARRTGSSRTAGT
ncbi:MAG: hypothetical protein H0V86_10575 [Chloroflexia bacterium]|nr:hypothetical protein [Chloroflexia bacterium]